MTTSGKQFKLNFSSSSSDDDEYKVPSRNTTRFSKTKSSSTSSNEFPKPTSKFAFSETDSEEERKSMSKQFRNFLLYIKLKIFILEKASKFKNIFTDSEEENKTNCEFKLNKKSLKSRF